MNTTTAITTAARRITRQINATVAEITVSFDRDGRHVSAHESGMHYANPAHEPDHAVKLHGRKNRAEKLTRRAAQDLLDAAGYAATSPDDVHAMVTYLADLDAARRIPA